jgi:hypothetical protein
LGGKKGCCPAQQNVYDGACCPFDSPAGLFSTAESIHIWQQPDFFFFFRFSFLFRGRPKLLFPSYSSFYLKKIRNKILCWAENLPGEMAVRTPPINKNVKMARNSSFVSVKKK